MKNTLLALLSFILLSTPLAATAQFHDGDFYFEFSDSGLSGLTITGYTGPGGDVTIPGYLYDSEATGQSYPVKHIGNGAFYHQTNLTSVTIPSSVISIGDFPGGAFESCTSLTNLTLPGSITYIGYLAFRNCTSLKGVFFKGNKPGSYGNAFLGANNAVVYYLPGTTEWYGEFNGAPTRLWNPVLQPSGPGFGVWPTGFGFDITGTADIPIVVEACTNLATPNWVSLQSLNLTNGAFHFSDPNWKNYPARNYRIRSP